MKILFYFLYLLLNISFSLCYNTILYNNFNLIAENGTYSCSEIQKWMKNEKHYSNERKNSLFELMNEKNCLELPVIKINNIIYSQYHKNNKYFIQQNDNNNNNNKCLFHDKIAVIFLSNYSINHNYSHFLHALLRLFCSLIDMRLLIWNSNSLNFNIQSNFSIWMDENFKLPLTLMEWMKPFNTNIKQLQKLPKGQCASAKTLYYGSGCVKLLPPEKWYGYPGCRANHILPAFSTFIKSYYGISHQQLPSINIINSKTNHHQHIHHNNPQSITSSSSSSTTTTTTIADNTINLTNNYLNIVFGVRRVGSLTGTRTISNLQTLQNHLSRTLRVNNIIKNISFETLSPSEVITSLSNTHIFISIHGAGMTNTFFMSPGSVVVEILPYPLCSCRSPDYFYGYGGYYQGSSLALGLKHYIYCVDSYHTIYHTKPSSLSTDSGINNNPSNSNSNPTSSIPTNPTNNNNNKCSWKYLHAVEEVILEEGQFTSFLRGIERDLIASGMIILNHPIINMNPHANG